VLCRSALAKLSATAAAAGVQLVPVLLLEGPEAAMTVRQSDLRAIGAPLFGGSSHSGGQHQQQHGLLYVEDAAALLASALQVPAAQVCSIPIQGLLLPAASPAGSSSSNGGVLSAVGGLGQQYQLLEAVHRLEGHIASVMQLQQQQPVGPAGMLSKL
jgi:hypothetical protein